MTGITFPGWTGAEGDRARDWVNVFKSPITAAHEAYASASKAVSAFGTSLQSAQSKMATERPLAEAAWDSKVRADGLVYALNHLPEKNDSDSEVRQVWTTEHTQAVQAQQAAAESWSGHVATANGIHSEVTSAATTATNSLRAIAAPPYVPNFPVTAHIGGGMPQRPPIPPVPASPPPGSPAPPPTPPADVPLLDPLLAFNGLVFAGGAGYYGLDKWMQGLGADGKVVYEGDQYLRASSISQMPIKNSAWEEYMELVAKDAPAAERAAAVPPLPEFGTGYQAANAAAKGGKGLGIVSIAVGGYSTYQDIKQGKTDAAWDDGIGTALAVGSVLPIPGVQEACIVGGLVWGGAGLAVKAITGDPNATVTGTIKSGISKAWNWLTH